MKAILVLAVFVLAASALKVNITAYEAGFNDQLGLNGTQAQDAARCQSSIARAAADVEKLSKATNAQSFALAALDLYADVRREVLVECKLYVNDLLTLALTNANSTDALKALVESNLKKYAPQVIQQVTLWIDAFIGGNDYEAGQKEAYVFQILLGLETPEALHLNVFNYTKYVPLNQSKFIWETQRIYFTKIGMSAEDVNTTLQCAENFPTISEKLSASIRNMSDLTTLEDKLVASKAIYAQFIDTGVPCIKAFKASWNFTAPQRNLFLRSPILFVATILHNVGLNATQLVELANNQQINLLQGEYVEAGESMAQLFKIMYNGLF